MIEKIKDVVLPLLVVLIIIGWGLFLTFKEIDKEDLMIFNKESDCRSNVASLTAVMSMYVADYNGYWPNEPNDYVSSIFPYVKNEDIFRCPRDRSKYKINYLNPEGGTDNLYLSYAFNVFLAGKHETEIYTNPAIPVLVEAERTPVVFLKPTNFWIRKLEFENDFSRRVIQEATSRHKDGVTVGWADGNVTKEEE
ncbi:hypothetical protein J7K05_01440 [bacterium]|nr:hypothetical protein [bacterium]